MILESVEHSLLIWPTIEENGVTRIKKYDELSVVEKIQADCDIKATNIILQGLQSDIYSLVNHHRVTKDLWERIQLLMQGDDPIAYLNKEMAFLTVVASLRNASWYKEKALLADVQEAGQILDEEQLAFLGDPGVPDVLMANISNYSSDVISEKAQWIKPTLYDGIVMFDKHVDMPLIDDEKTLILEEESRSRMFEKENKPSDALPIKIKAPKELPKISLVNESLKKHKFYLAKFDNAVKIRTTPNARTEENSMAKLRSENERLCNEISYVKQVFKEQFDSIKQTRIRTKEQSNSVIDKLNLKSAENEDLKAQIQDKVVQIVFCTVRFGNDHIARIMGYGDYQLGNVTISKTLREFYENVGISHQTSVARTPQQNDVVERQNQTLVEAAHTMLVFSKASLFLWAEAIKTTCYTQNCSIIRRRYNKTPYELIQDTKPDLSFFYVFGALYYPTNDNDDLGKLDAKADIGIFIGYAPAKKAFRIYNKRTWKIIETIHVTFDELTTMVSE
uniref:Retrovirus-related Pol polyprotein from transposon TNT 1-94 n=1 Tax=Tanacetum cinerariifolium TaxID=118510 RepID=A0A6L2JMD4_TANCI|nr:retrovirus-related Pol polyprotein from transposon TNT 1-94 [Tanacetum cinerariifolium]